MHHITRSTRRLSTALTGLAVIAVVTGCGDSGQAEANRQRAAVDAYNNHGAPAAPTSPPSQAAPASIETAAISAPAPVLPSETAAPPSDPVARTVTPAVQMQAQTTKPAPSATPSPSVPAQPRAAPPAGGLPPGPGRETVQRVCTSCHAIGMVTAKGRTPDGWSEIIGRMMGLGLEASDEDLQTVHAYLSRNLPPR